jgi:hypothetical protein
VTLALSYLRGEIGSIVAAGWTFIGSTIVVYGVRDSFVKVKATQEGLEVINYLSRKNLVWDEISHFVGPRRMRRWTASAVLVSGKRISLDAIPATALPFGPWPRRADTAVSELNGFLEEKG